MPFVMNAVLVQGHRMSRLRNAHSYNPNIDPDMSFCQRARDQVSWTLLPLCFVCFSKHPAGLSVCGVVVEGSLTLSPRDYCPHGNFCRLHFIIIIDRFCIVLYSALEQTVYTG